MFHHVHTSKIHVLWMLEKMLGFVFLICLSFKDGSLFKITLPTKSFELVWHVALAQVWTHYKIRKLNVWTLFCNVCIKILNSQIWKEIMLELSGKPSSLTHHVLNWIFLPKPGFFGNLFVFFRGRNQYLPHSESKSYQINSIKSRSSRSSQQHQTHIPIPLKFSAMI